MKKLLFFSLGFTFVMQNTFSIDLSAKTFDGLSADTFADRSINSSWSGKSFNNMDLSNRDLSNFDLANCTFTNVIFNRTILTSAKLIGATFNNCTMVGTIFKGIDLTNSVFNNGTIEQVNIENVILRNTQFNNTKLGYITVVGDSGDGKNIGIGYNMQDIKNSKDNIVNFISDERTWYDKSKQEKNKDLKDYFQKAYNSMIYLTPCMKFDLLNYDFSKAKKNLNNCSLEMVNLTGCNLSNCDLSNCNISETNFTFANLTKANLNKIFCSKYPILISTRVSKDSVLPDHTIRPCDLNWISRRQRKEHDLIVQTAGQYGNDNAARIIIKNLINAIGAPADDNW